MNKVKTKAEIITYEETKPEKVVIESHWNWGDRVHLKIGKETVVVLGRDIISAVNKCLN